MTLHETIVDPFGARDVFETGTGQATLYRLTRLEDAGLTRLAALPYSLRVLLESLVRHCDGVAITPQDVQHLAGWNAAAPERVEIPFMPARVILQDFTGVPAVVDLAAMRSAMARLGGDPRKVNPLIPVDLVIDHSVQVDRFGSPGALAENVRLEFLRNRERYALLRWAQRAFENFRVIPPSVGIIHQVNLEYLAKGVFLRRTGDDWVAIPDSLVGTDSHTTMINGLGVVGWGVGGIEAEAVMLGQPLSMLLPEVIGLELCGSLPAGATATDLVLRVTELLRKEGVVSKFVEFFGPGVAGMSVADRATLANMAPEYGATMGFFPIDGKTLEYLRLSGRSDAEVTLVERYAKEQLLFRTEQSPLPTYTKVLSLDMGTVEPCLAGPKRPQDRVVLREVKTSFRRALVAPTSQRGYGLAESELSHNVRIDFAGQAEQAGARLGHGAVVIAAITSCTNTSNPAVMVAAGLLARNAVQRGLRVPPHVKTSLAPGSRVVTDYLVRAGLDKPLETLGFHTVGYGCTTCIGNSGPLPEPVARAVQDGRLVVAAVLSGNRNFEGRVHPLVKANYLASPPLVVAYALAGTVDRDLLSEPLGTSADGQPVFLRDIWPSDAEIEAVIRQTLDPQLFRQRYSTGLEDNPMWAELPVPEGELFPWDPQSTYIQEPPFLQDTQASPPGIVPIRGARVLLALGDSVTTDHISPAGSIPADSPAGQYLIAQGVSPADFNSYGARRGNDRVMTRGTFANVRLRNLLVPSSEGGVTRHFPSGQVMSVYDAAMKYRQEKVPLLVLAGAEYGTGSSRDWAAKGTYLLGIRAVLAASFERIHRSNLVGMGVLPLEFQPGQTWQSLGLSGQETFDFPDLAQRLAPAAVLPVQATTPEGRVIEFAARARIDTPLELEYYRNGGILPTVLRKLLLP